jgi:hypothetical protein
VFLRFVALHHSRICSFPGNPSRVAPTLTRAGNNETVKGAGL